MAGKVKLCPDCRLKMRPKRGKLVCPKASAHARCPQCRGRAPNHGLGCPKAGQEGRKVDPMNPGFNAQDGAIHFTAGPRPSGYALL